jgi:hypothetical protein
MAALKVSDELAKTIQGEAMKRGVSVEEFLQSVILHEKTLAARRKIEKEQDWWLNLPLSERAKYEGEYVAVNNQQLVDHDMDSEALHNRIRAKYGKTPILIMPAKGPQDIHIFSPHLIQE